MKVDDLMGALFRYCNDYGIILAVRVSSHGICQPETWIKVGWCSSGKTSWEEWETNMDCFEVISEDKR